MILWCDGGHGPAENMRRDAALLEAAGAGAEPVLRLFTFVPPGITLGRAQDPARELDLERCRAAGVPWAVRPTGGRAIYHDEEWTYSLAAPLGDPAWGGGLEAAYGAASRMLVASLQRLGVPAALAPGNARGDLAPRAARGAAAPCFASTARHEIVLDGRKLVGSAQRRTARALLQQGSVLLGTAHLRLADFLAVAADAREGVRAGLERVSAHAGPWLGPRPPLARWADALQAVLPTGTRRLEGDEGLRLAGDAPPAASGG
jgi:lipoate-protein ligase A